MPRCGAAVLAGFALGLAVLVALGVSMWRQAAMVEKARTSGRARPNRFGRALV